MPPPFKIAQAAAACLGAALIMAAWSELIFFNEEPANALIAALQDGGVATLAIIAELALFYTLPSTFLIGLLALFGSHGPTRVLILGALTGFCIEGAMVPAVYEAVPLSFVWTSVAWHGPITVGLGVFLLPRCLAAVTPLRMTALAMILGPFWALWTTWPWSDADFTRVAPGTFQMLLAVPTAMLLLGYGLLRLAGWPNVRMSRWVAWALISPTLLCFILQGAAAPLAALGVLAILVGLYALLRRCGPHTETRYRVRWPNVLTLLLIPVSAGLVYAWLFDTGPPIPPEDLVFLVAASGLIVWIVGVALGLRRLEQKWSG